MTTRMRAAIPFLLILLYASFPNFSQGQDSLRVIHLEQAIKAAMDNNKTISLARLDEKIAQSKYRETDAVFLPQVGVSYAAMNTNNPLNAFGFKLQQKGIESSDFNPSYLNDPGGTADFMTKIEINQPLVNMDMVYQRRAANRQQEIYQFKTERTAEYIEFQVKQFYMQLQLAHHSVTVLEDALSTSRAMHSFTKHRFEQGLLQRSDVLNTEVHIANLESQLESAKTNILIASDRLGILMGDNNGYSYRPAEPATGFQKESFTDTVPDDRADFKAMEKAIAASDLMIRSGKMAYLPKLNAFGSYQLNDNSMLGFGADSYMAGIQLSWNIFNGNRTKNSITTRQIERNKLVEQLSSEKDESQAELNKALRQLSDAAFNIEQKNKAVQLAGEALRILQNRYQQGLVNTIDIMLAETQHSRERLSHAEAIFNYNLTSAYIQFLTSSSKK